MPQTGQLQQQQFVCTQFWRLEVQVKVLANFVPGESSFPGLQMDAFLQCAHMVFPHYICAERKLKRKNTLASLLVRDVCQGSPEKLNKQKIYVSLYHPVHSNNFFTILVSCLVIRWIWKKHVRALGKQTRRHRREQVWN